MKFFSILFFILSTAIFAQKDSYWDNQRATKKEIGLSAKERIVVKTDDFPVGTTEIVFRITVLDENQQLSNSLVSLLKTIPDPTGISQGSAGAIFLLSKISGNDKCKYAIFSNENLAKNYQKNTLTNKSCFIQKEAVNKVANRIKIDKSGCLNPNTKSLWFCFESTNWLMNQKIILEVVPWVNAKLSRGWNPENKKKILNECKNLPLAKNSSNSDLLCLCVLEKFEKSYTFQETQDLLAIEKSKKTTDFLNTCFLETGESKKRNMENRAVATELIKQEKYSEGISKLQQLITENAAISNDYNAIGFAFICTKQFDKALKHLKEAEKLDNSDLNIQLNLAHVNLLKNNFKTSKSIHKKYLNQNVSDSLSWIQKTKQDFETFKKAGLLDTDFSRILNLFEN